MENLLSSTELNELSYGAIAWCVFILYFFPTIIAIIRDHDSFFSILVLNLFVGWTFIGWVVSLALALSGRKKVYVRNRRSTVSQLDLLARLKEKGHLSDKEFDKQKRKLLA